jgi:hypothetical protein
MQYSIIESLNEKGYKTEHLNNDTLIFKINELMTNNNCLKLNFTNEGTVNIRKKLKNKNGYKYNYSYNIKIQITSGPYSSGYYEELLGKMGVPINLSYIYEGITSILKDKKHRSNISEEELKLIKDRKDKDEEEELEAFTEYLLNKINNDNSESNNNTYSNQNTLIDNIENINDEEMFDEDPYSEKSIMRDLENGEGEKHGF